MLTVLHHVGTGKTTVGLHMAIQASNGGELFGGTWDPITQAQGRTKVFYIDTEGRGDNVNNAAGIKETRLGCGKGEMVHSLRWYTRLRWYTTYRSFKRWTDYGSLMSSADIVYEEIVGEYLTPLYIKSLLARMMDEKGVSVSLGSPLVFEHLDMFLQIISLFCSSFLSILGTYPGHHRFFDICPGSLSFG